MNQIRQDLGHVHLHEVRDQVPMDAMPVAHAHQPQIPDIGEVVVYHEVVLVGLLLSWDVPLPGLDTVADHRAAVFVILFNDVQRACACLRLHSGSGWFDHALWNSRHAEAGLGVLLRLAECLGI